MQVTFGFDIGLDSIAVAAVTSGPGMLTCTTIARSISYIVEGKTVRDFDTRYAVNLRRVARMAYEHQAIVHVEQSYGALNLKTFKALSHVEAEIRYELARRDVHIRFVAPSAWQSAILHCTQPRTKLEELSLKSARDFMRACCMSRNAISLLTVHEADALNIARHAYEENYGVW